MKKVLLANIGNRNLKYKGELFHAETNLLSFKNWTKQLLDTYSDVKDDLQINILDDLLIKNEYDSIFIFPTNQVLEQKQDQDTLYEAEILKLLIEQKYNTPVDISNQVQCKVTDNDLLLSFYRKQLGIIKSENLETFIEVCDAGGTAQMKSSLKIILEFLFSKNKFKISYVNPNGTVEEVPQIQYRKIIEAYQIESLVKSGSFDAAASFAKNNDFKLIEDLCKIAHLRKNFIWQDAQNLIEGKLKEDEKYLFLKRFKRGDLSDTYDECFKQDFPKKHNFFLLCEKLIVSEFYYHKKEYSNLVLSLSIFIESFLSEFVQRNEGLDLTNNYYSDGKKLVNIVENKYPLIKEVFRNDKNPDGDLKMGVPVLLCYCAEKSGSLNIKNIADIFKQMNSMLNGKYYGLDSMRNEIAHKGKSISPAEFQKTLPLFGALFGLLKREMGLPQKNALVEITEAVSDELKTF
jgi:hypothetical protein